MGWALRRPDSRGNGLSVIFVPTALPGAFIVEMERREDDRGFFARTWCRREFEQMGLSADLAQCNVSFSHRRGTLRGMHWQAAPYGEACRNSTRRLLRVVFDGMIPHSASRGR